MTGKAPGTKQELIEALAAIHHREWWALLHPEVEPAPWAHLSDFDKQDDRDDVTAFYWPLIVAFVGQWLATEPEDGHRPALHNLAADWREEMGQ